VRRSLLFLHGLGADAGVWAELRAALEARGHPTRAFDLPGYGGTPRVPEPSIAAFAEALAARLEREVSGPVVVVGHSIGGMVALELALRWPERVAALVLCATTAAFGSRDGSFQQRFLEERLAPLEAGRRLAELAPEVIPRLVGRDPDPQGLRRAVEAMARVPEAAWRDALRALVGFDRRSDLAHVRVPVLLVAGARDVQAPAATMKRMAVRLPDAVFALVSGAGHLVPFEQPRAFRALVERFLRERLV